MIPAVIVVVCLVILAVPVVWLIRKLALRVVGVAPRRKVIVARSADDVVALPKSTLTSAPGRYGLWFGPDFVNHALVGDVESATSDHVHRRTLGFTAPLPSDPFDAQLTGHVMHSPAQIYAAWEDVTVPLRDGSGAPAWLFRADDPGQPWVIHIQGIRTSRLVTLRSVEAAKRAELTSLVITYRGSGDGPPTVVSSLGQREWTDLEDAIGYARSQGAPAVYIVAWSMGAGLALELLRQQPDAFERLALIAPATDWKRIMQHGVRRSGLPSAVASIVAGVLSSRFGSKLVGMPNPLDFNRLNWIDRYSLTVPTLVLHSPGDEEIPFELTKQFAAAHPSVRLVETATAPHGWEANVDPELFQDSLTAWLATTTSSSQQ
jgi:pimeloyl-ACP methyl ester carboxylesterase